MLAAGVAFGANSMSYKITGGAYERVGCSPPCLCAVWELLGFEGSFDLDFVEMDGDFAVFDMNNVVLLVEAWTPGEVIEITGSGTYRIGGDDRLMQEMTLTLDADGFIQTFETGLVPAESAFPTFDVAAVVEGVCQDTVLDIVAEPLGDADRDFDVDLVDFNAFQLCFGEAPADGADISEECVFADFDNDQDVDLTDFADFQLNYTGTISLVVPPELWDIPICPEGMLCL
jgi:hypothetical protein